MLKTHETFEIHKRLSNGEIYHSPITYWNSDTMVRINAFLPSRYNEIGSCIIEINGEQSITSLRHNDIMDLIKRKNKSGIREVVLSGNSFENTKSFTCFGTLSVHLDNDIFDQLISILDDFLIEYKNQYNKFEHFIDASEFKRKEDYYVLRKATRAEWRKLIEHSRLYDLDKGTSSNYCFNHNGETVVALDKASNSIKFWLFPGHSDYLTFRTFLYPDGELEILWRIPSKEDRILIETGNVWTAKRTFEWINKIIK